jgi:hypothetical protein
MRIELRTSGGVTGVARPPIVLDTAGLDPSDAAALEALAERVRDQPSGPAGPDRFQYDLRLGERTVRLHEGALSPEAAELIERLRQGG